MAMIPPHRSSNGMQNAFVLEFFLSLNLMLVLELELELELVFDLAPWALLLLLLLLSPLLLWLLESILKLESCLSFFDAGVLLRFTASLELYLVVLALLLGR